MKALFKNWVDARKCLLKRIRAASTAHVVYQDYDAICLRASNGRDLTFTINPEIDRGELIADLRRQSSFDRYIYYRHLPVLGLYWNHNGLHNPKGQKKTGLWANLMTDGEKLSPVQVGRKLKISSWEVNLMLGHARQRLFKPLLNPDTSKPRRHKIRRVKAFSGPDSGKL